MSYLHSARATCVVVGHDGFDLDVLANLRSLYRSLGFTVISSRKIIDADVVVIHRPPNSHLDLSGCRVVHVWDYVGADISKFLTGLPRTDGLRVFVSSARRSSELAEAEPSLKPYLWEMLPPVDVGRWVSSNTTRNHHRVVHVGNVKPFYVSGDDVYASRFLEFLADRGAHVWGDGWRSFPGIRNHGRARLRDVSAIYANSSFAAGMMYPFQRGVTISGRFWHAPLNGCLVLTEAMLEDFPIPGVVPVDYSSEMQRLMSRGHSGSQVALEAKEFWESHWNSACDVVAGHIAATPSPRSARRVPVAVRVEDAMRNVKHYRAV